MHPIPSISRNLWSCRLGQRIFQKDFRCVQRFTTHWKRFWMSGGYQPELETRADLPRTWKIQKKFWMSLWKRSRRAVIRWKKILWSHWMRRLVNFTMKDREFTGLKEKEKNAPQKRWSHIIRDWLKNIRFFPSKTDCLKMTGSDGNTWRKNWGRKYSWWVMICL